MMLCKSVTIHIIGYIIVKTVVILFLAVLKMGEKIHTREEWSNENTKARPEIGEGPGNVNGKMCDLD